MALFEQSVSTGNYYDVTISGFNFVDEECDKYLRALFVLDKSGDRIKSGISSAGTLTNAILGATSTPANTIVVVAQAFGIAAEFSGVIKDSYLYNAEPRVIFSVVEKLQGAYRKQTASDRYEINSRATSYHRIRGYLRLCSAPTIEAKINEALAASSADTNSRTGTQFLAPGDATLAQGGRKQ
ncbi:MAG: hypothetical protein CL534_14835 [Ahrensia sp.]|nr:hypothetical protein [Ahrensia sp.]